MQGYIPVTECSIYGALESVNRINDCWNGQLITVIIPLRVADMASRLCRLRLWRTPAATKYNQSPDRIVAFIQTMQNDRTCCWVFYKQFLVLVTAVVSTGLQKSWTSPSWPIVHMLSCGSRGTFSRGWAGSVALRPTAEEKPLNQKRTRSQVFGRMISRFF